MTRPKLPTLASLALVTVLVLTLHTPKAKTLDLRNGEVISKTILNLLKGELQNAEGLASLLGGLTRGEDEALGNVKKLLLQKLPQLNVLQNLVPDAAGVGKDIVKPFLTIAKKMTKMNKKKPLKNKSEFDKIFETVLEGLVAGEDEEEQNTPPGDGVVQIDEAPNGDFKSQLLQFAKEAFEEKFGNLTLNSASQTHVSNLNTTVTSVWVIVKSTWQRILSFVKEENAMENFMQLTPVRFIDWVLSLGDELSLADFLAKKLDPSLAKFLAMEINPYLGPLENFATFYNFTRELGVNSVVDYFTSDKFKYNINALSRFVSAYMEDTVSDDLVNQYIEFISFNSTDLLNFYKSVLQSQGKTVDRGDDDVVDSRTVTQRYKRDVLQGLANSYISQPLSEADTSNARQLQHRYGNSPMASVYDPARDGGYGGGGYGSGGGYGYGMNMGTLDPYVVLGALALGTILGFLLFRALRGTGGGRRSMNDGSLSLWLSDIPQQAMPWASSANVDRMKRGAEEKDEKAIKLPEALRGDVWSSDPLVTSDVFEDDLKEEDLADHLNHLWQVYEDSDSPACVHSHLCGVVANSTAEDLTGKYSSIAILMASLSNMVGVARPGQLVDQVTHSLVFGTPHACPSPLVCPQLL